MIASVSNTKSNVSVLSPVATRPSKPGFLLSAEHVTTATYIPLVGMASMTDPSGRETTYEYNAHNHLMRVRDHKGKVVNEYEYSFDQ